MEFQEVASLPKRACCFQGCRNSQPCADHPRRAFATIPQRASASRRGYGRRWATYSQACRRANPLCKRCESNGRLTLSQMVDHIVPVESGADPLFWAADNHQALCWPCHRIKTAQDIREGVTSGYKKGEGRFNP